ncbi:hypothetical protein MMC13_005894 [Lambiella insularis]|nr:hypothetical protein [Lambiella insularis]
MQICPRIHIPADFDWRGGNGLYIEMFYNARDDQPLVGLPIPRPRHSEAINLDIDQWPVWDKESEEWKVAKFQFCELQQLMHYCTSSLCIEEPLGQIRIAVRRIRILSYFQGMELGKRGDEAALRTVSSTLNYRSLGSVNLSISISSLEAMSFEGRTLDKFKFCGGPDGLGINLRFLFRRQEFIDNPIDFFLENNKEREGHVVELEAVELEPQVEFGEPINFIEYFRTATAMDPLNLFSRMFQPNADELAQEQVLQRNMGPRDTRPGFISRPIAICPGDSGRTPEGLLNAPIQIHDVSSDISDDDVQYQETRSIPDRRQGSVVVKTENVFSRRMRRLGVSPPRQIPSASPVSSLGPVSPPRPRTLKRTASSDLLVALQVRKLKRERYRTHRQRERLQREARLLQRETRLLKRRARLEDEEVELDARIQMLTRGGGSVEDAVKKEESDDDNKNWTREVNQHQDIEELIEDQGIDEVNRDTDADEVDGDSDLDDDDEESGQEV